MLRQILKALFAGIVIGVLVSFNAVLFTALVGSEAVTRFPQTWLLFGMLPGILLIVIGVGFFTLIGWRDTVTLFRKIREVIPEPIEYYYGMISFLIFPFNITHLIATFITSITDGAGPFSFVASVILGISAFWLGTKVFERRLLTKAVKWLEESSKLPPLISQKRAPGT